MYWPSIGEMAAMAPLPDGYRYSVLRREEILELIAATKVWYPDISVGNASCYLRAEFYVEQVMLAGEAERDLLVLLFKHGEQLVGFCALQRNRDALTLQMHFGVVAPEHRGARLGLQSLGLLETVGRFLGAEFIYGLATLKVTYLQKAFEQLGYQLIGIMPGYDRELIAGTRIRRVFEAVYVKVLASPEALLYPDAEALTPQTQALFTRLFPR